MNTSPTPDRAILSHVRRTQRVDIPVARRDETSRGLFAVHRNVVASMMCLLAGYLLVGNAQAGVGACVEDATTACLVDGQFRVTVSYDGNGAQFVPPSVSLLSGDAVRTSVTDDTALFSFYGPQHFDLAVKVLEGCPVNNKIWVFAALPTDSGLVLTVEDTSNAFIRQYVSAAAAAAAPIVDTSAFDCSAVRAVAAAEKSTAIAGKGSCGHAFCLVGGRFGLDIAFNTPGSTGVGMPLAESAENSALVWLFDPSNLEAVVSMIDGRSDSGTFWFLASAIGNAGMNYRLTDTLSGLTNDYVQPFGQSLTLRDDGAALVSSMTPVGGSVAPGGTARFALRLANETSGSRRFRLLVPTPAGVTNPQFTCQASASASCPNASGTGPLDETGELPAGGVLSYEYSVTVSTSESAISPLQVDATATTLADALAPDRSSALSAQLPIIAVATQPTTIPSLGVFGLIFTLLLIGWFGVARISRAT